MTGGFKVPQYLRSDDPEVVAAVEANEAGVQAWAERAWAFAQKYGVPDRPGTEAKPLVRTSFGDYRVTGVSGEQPDVGKWRRLKNGGWAPYARNPVSAEMAQVAFRRGPVPGLPEMVTGSDGSASLGGIVMMWPVPFVEGGAVWVKFSTAGVSASEVGPQWREVLGSQVMGAYERKFPKDES